MKKMIYISVLLLIAAGGIFWSCQKDEMLTHSEDELMLKKAQTQQVISEVIWDSPVCMGIEHTFILQGWMGTKNIGVQIYDESISEWVPVPGLPNGQVSSPQNFVYTFPAEGTYQLRYSVSGNAADGGTNGQKVFDVTVLNCTNCEESFTYVNNNDGKVTFTYQPAVDMIDVPVVFTFPQVEFIKFLSGYEFESFARPGNGNAQNMQTVLSFTACVVYTWTVQLVDCTAANATANGWTDFKVNDVSKKNSETPNITYECPE